MEFRLVNEGPLKANGTVRDKHDIRRSLHDQFIVLWQQPPLNCHREFLEETSADGKTSILRRVGAFTFAPLVCQKLHLTAHLHIVFLRPEPPGALITQGGDIDNRLKTLFDALRMPQVESEIPRGDDPQANEHPFFCLLEDDNLITAVAVDTDRLLRLQANDSHVQLIITVNTKAIITWDNNGL